MPSENHLISYSGTNPKTDLHTTTSLSTPVCFKHQASSSSATQPSNDVINDSILFAPSSAWNGLRFWQKGDRNVLLGCPSRNDNTLARMP
mmetsp:Transcript_29696/g.62062  ORF Transcript_29696/g.62062 Transcript_29696/m.62062 type:complete len:90 (-) Transcript_29696:394-663(-)